MGVVKKLIPYGRQWVDDDDVTAVTAQLRDDWLTQGPSVQKFEAALCNITGARFAVAVSSGTAALHLACLAAGVKHDDRAIVPDVTFVATANAVRYAGGTPVLVDVEASTGLMGATATETASIRSPPRAILPVSFAGVAADLPRMRAVADRFGAVVIEDAAHSLGATYSFEDRTYHSGSCAHTDMATLSFHPVKHLTTGEGGAVTTNDENLCSQLRDLRTHGITKDPQRLERNDGPWFYEQQSLGFNYRITDIQCALGVSQARKFPRFLARRREIARQYDDAFAKDEHVRPLIVPAGSNSAYHLYVLRVTPDDDDLSRIAARRRALFMRLRELGVAAQVHYIPIHIQPDYRRAGLAEGSFGGAEAYYAGCMSIPMYPALTDADVVFVIDAVRDACRSTS